MDRRSFLKSTVAVTGATLVGGNVQPSEAVKDGATAIQKYNRIGTTDLKMSDIAFGAGKLPSSSLVERAFDMGMNYYDTAPDYGHSETLLGKFVAARKGDRSKMIIASKICATEPYPAHLPAGTPPEKMIEAVEGSLKRLQTDYLDVLFVHALAENDDDEKRIRDENLPVALEKLKKAGKIRYTAFSSHGPKKMEATVSMAVDSGLFDLMMVAFNFGDFPDLMPVIKKAHGKGMGVLAMKTLAGAKHADIENFKQGDADFEQAALRWVTSHPEISGAVITVKNVDQLRRYVAVSGTKLTVSDNMLLDRYANSTLKENCRIGCGECLESCAEGVNIATILRYNMYYENYIDHKDVAIERYAALKKDASACADCADDACARGCPFGLPVRALLQRAHRNLAVS